MFDTYLMPVTLENYNNLALFDDVIILSEFLDHFYKAFKLSQKKQNNINAS